MRKLLSLAVVSLLLTTSCSDSGRDNTGDTEKPTGSIRVQISGEAEETAVYDAVVDTFESDNPGIQVELTKVADKDDHLAKLTTSFAAGDPPDVFLVNYREYAQFVTRGAIEAVEGHLKDAGIDLDLYFPQPLEAFTFDGTLQCMPQNVSSLVVYYNRKLFRQAGVKPPNDGWSFEEFRDITRALTRGDVHGLGIDPEIIRLAPFAWSAGGEIVDDEDAPTRFTLDDPATRKALEFLVSLVRDDQVVPSEKEVSAQDLETRFVTGKLGMLLSSRKDTPVFREVLGLDWDVLPLPTDQQQAGILHSDAYCIAASSENVVAALEFVAFAVGQQGQTLTALAGRTVPSMKAVARSGAFLDPSQPPAHSRVFLDAVPYIRRTPVIPTWPEIEDIAKEILTRAFYEPGYTVDDAIRELDEATRPLFEEAAQG